MTRSDRLVSIGLRWFACVRRGAHSFDENGVCTNCTARRDGPRLVDILADREGERS